MAAISVTILHNYYYTCIMWVSEQSLLWCLQHKRSIKHNAAGIFNSGVLYSCLWRPSRTPSLFFLKRSMMPGWHHAVSELAWPSELETTIKLLAAPSSSYHADGKWTKGFAKEINFLVTNLKLTAIFDAILFSKNMKGDNL